MSTMTTMTKEKSAKLLFLFITIFTAFQGFIPSIPNIGAHTTTLLSAIVLYAVSIMTLIRQSISEQIDNDAKKVTWFVILIASIGGLNDLTNLIHFSEATDQWVRFGITFTTFVLNLVSKIVWNTPETGKQII